MRGISSVSDFLKGFMDDKSDLSDGVYIAVLMDGVEIANQIYSTNFDYIEILEYWETLK